MIFYSSTLSGVTPVLVEIEIDISIGLPFFQIVGLPDEVLRESKTRVKSAILQSGYDFPFDRRVVLNLSPSKLKKNGSGFELGLATKILWSSGKIEMPELNILFLGELALDGHVKPVDDLQALAQAAQGDSKVDLIVIPKEDLENLRQAQVSCEVLGITHLRDFLTPKWWEKKGKLKLNKIKRISEDAKQEQDDFLKSEFSAFWAEHLKISAVGRHHYLLCGPPGSGKTYFAESLKQLRSFETLKCDTQLKVLNSLFGRYTQEMPWSAPHHSASLPGIVGGGNPPRPGSITRAHGGILFLDELLEFSPHVLDSLREPLEKGVIEVSRACYQIKFPARFQLISATNPCRCGYWKSDFAPCVCSTAARQRYQLKLSGPLLDRFDVKLLCKSLHGNERKVSGRSIRDEFIEILKFKKMNSKPILSDFASQYIQDKMGKEIGNYRLLLKTKILAQTLAYIELKKVIDLKHIQRAIELQTLALF